MSDQATPTPPAPRDDGKANRPRIYMAGPDVFMPYPLHMAECKKEILARYGIEGAFPFDNEIKDIGTYPDKKSVAREIARLNFEMMDRCEGCIAHLTPYSGPSADVGTVGEVHYMFAQSKPVFGYSNDARSFYEIVRDDVYRGRVFEMADEKGNPTGFKTLSGITVENYGLPDNLMVDYAIEASGGTFRRIQAPPHSYYTALDAFELAAFDLAVYFYGRAFADKLLPTVRA